MKRGDEIKNALLSAAVGYIVATDPEWNMKLAMVFIGILSMIACWELILKIEQLFRWIKRRNARGAATPCRAHLKITFK